MPECKFFKYCETSSDNCSKKDECTKCNINRPMSIIKHYQRKYCSFDPEACARYKVRTELGNEYLPSDLLPTEMELAKKIINEKYKN